MFFVAAASAAAVDDADKKQDKRGVLGLGYGAYGGYGGYGAPLAAPIAAPIAAAPLAAYHAPLGLHAPAIGKLSIQQQLKQFQFLYKMLCELANECDCYV